MHFYLYPCICIIAIYVFHKYIYMYIYIYICTYIYKCRYIDIEKENKQNIWVHANVSKPGENGLSALMRSARYGHSQCIDILLRNRADANWINRPDGETALKYAAMNGELECMRALLNNKAQVDLCTPGGRTPLDAAITFLPDAGKAISEKYMPILQLLLDSDADVNLMGSALLPIPNIQ